MIYPLFFYLSVMKIGDERRKNHSSRKVQRDPQLGYRFHGPRRGPQGSSLHSQRSERHSLVSDHRIIVRTETVPIIIESRRGNGGHSGGPERPARPRRGERERPSGLLGVLEVHNDGLRRGPRPGHTIGSGPLSSPPNREQLLDGLGDPGLGGLRGSGEERYSDTRLRGALRGKLSVRPRESHAVGHRGLQDRHAALQ